MISLPADPGGTLRTTFGDDLSVEDYGRRWVLYRFDAATNNYALIPLDSQLEVGVGYWILQNTGGDVTLDLPAASQPFAATTSAPCPVAVGCIEIPLSARTNQAVTWNLVGYSGSDSMTLDETRFDTNSGACRNGCISSVADAEGLLRMPMYHYTGTPANQPYRLVTSNALLNPWEGYWLAMLEAAGALQPRWLQPLRSADDTDNTDDESQRDAARLLAQASFGPSESSISAVLAAGLEGWIDAQLALPVNPQTPRYKAVANNGSHRGPRHEIWWQDAIDAEDQLRQRVAFALSELFVVADTGYTLGNAQEGMVAYYDLLLSGAFGSYRDLLEDVTLSPVMGIWLSMLQNAKSIPAENTRADENFAREILQLFSIGLVELNTDGTTKLVGGNPVPTYTTDDVESYARVFTGWNFAEVDRWNKILITSDNDYESPMTVYGEGEYHDSGEKTLLGGVVSPAGASAEQDLKIALDSIANHPNVAPFISRQLILKLVTSNPTPAYIGRVAAVFDASDGNLGATVKAILMDDEARFGPTTVEHFGKLREPILRVTHLWRAFDIERGTQSSDNDYNVGSPQKENLAGVLGQAPLKSPSVFNFFSPDNSPVGPLLNAGKLAPEAELYTEALILSTTERINRQIQFHHDAANDNGKKTSYLMLADERALADDPDALLDHLDTLLLSNSLSDELRLILIDHLNNIPVSASDPESGRSIRVRDAISLIMASPDYLVQM